MGGGLKAYKMAIGRHAKTEDLVYIFAEGRDVIPASVAAQEQFGATGWRQRAVGRDFRNGSKCDVLGSTK